MITVLRFSVEEADDTTKQASSFFFLAYVYQTPQRNHHLLRPSQGDKREPITQSTGRSPHARKCGMAHKDPRRRARNLLLRLSIYTSLSRPTRPSPLVIAHAFPLASSPLGFPRPPIRPVRHVEARCVPLFRPLLLSRSLLSGANFSFPTRGF
jgi:hypothetical protein